jgi:hypothetical protein
VIVCRDANLKPGGTMLPSGVELLIAPLDSTLLYDEEGPGFWRNSIHGIDFTHLEAAEVQQAIAVKTIIPPEDLLAPGKPILSLDLATAKVEDPWVSGEIEFIADRDGRLDGFAGWFVAQLSPSIALDTGPEQPFTHWKQTYFPFTPLYVDKGQRIKVTYALARHPVEQRSLEFKLTVDTESFTYFIG